VTKVGEAVKGRKKVEELLEVVVLRDEEEESSTDGHHIYIFAPPSFGQLLMFDVPHVNKTQRAGHVSA
jgi:hypothetical protein